MRTLFYFDDPRNRFIKLSPSRSLTDNHSSNSTSIPFFHYRVAFLLGRIRPVAMSLWLAVGLLLGPMGAWAVVNDYVISAPDPATIPIGSTSANFTVTFTGTPSANATVACTKSGEVTPSPISGTPITTTSASPVTISVPFTGAVAGDLITCTITPGTGDTAATATAMLTMIVNTCDLAGITNLPTGSETYSCQYSCSGSGILPNVSCTKTGTVTLGAIPTATTEYMGYLDVPYTNATIGDTITCAITPDPSYIVLGGPATVTITIPQSTIIVSPPPVAPAIGATMTTFGYTITEHATTIAHTIACQTTAAGGVAIPVPNSIPIGSAIASTNIMVSLNPAAAGGDVISCSVSADGNDISGPPASTSVAAAGTVTMTPPTTSVAAGAISVVFPYTTTGTVGTHPITCTYNGTGTKAIPTPSFIATPAGTTATLNGGILVTLSSPAVAGDVISCSLGTNGNDVITGSPASVTVAAGTATTTTTTVAPPTTTTAAPSTIITLAAPTTVVAGSTKVTFPYAITGVSTSDHAITCTNSSGMATPSLTRIAAGTITSGSITVALNPPALPGDMILCTLSSGGTDIINGSPAAVQVSTSTIESFLVNPEIDVYDGTLSIPTLSKTGIDFGTTVVGTPIKRTLTIKNPSAVDLNIFDFSGNLPSGFSLLNTSLASIIPPGGSTDLVFQCDAITTGTFGAAQDYCATYPAGSDCALRIPSNDDDNPSWQFNGDGIENPYIIPLKCVVSDGGNTAVPPTSPLGLVGTTVSDSQIALTWMDRSTTETAFIIERSSDSMNWVTIAQTGADVTAYQDSGLNCGTTYFYHIHAINETDESSLIIMASATTMVCPVTTNALTSSGTDLMDVAVNSTSSATSSGTDLMDVAVNSTSSASSATSSGTDLMDEAVNSTSSATSSGTDVSELPTQTPVVNEPLVESLPTLAELPLPPSNDGCPPKDTLSSFCDAGGQVVGDLNTVENSDSKEEVGFLTNAVITGTAQLSSGTWISNVHIAETGNVIGGTVTGLVYNSGYMGDFEFRGEFIKGGILGGTIHNVSKIPNYFEDVTLAPATHLIGGALTGTIQGDCQEPALLENLEVLAGSQLSCVILGKGVKLADDVVIIEGNSEPSADATESPSLSENTGTTEDSIVNTELDSVAESPNLGETISVIENSTVNNATTDVIELPELGVAEAFDKKGKKIDLDTFFTAGISVNGDSYHGNSIAQIFNDAVKIQGQMQIDEDHFGKKADIFVTVAYRTDETSREEFLFTFDGTNELVPWNGKTSSLRKNPFRKMETLQTPYLLEIYDGILFATGIVEINFGYITKDGTVVQTPTPIELTAIE